MTKALEEFIEKSLLPTLDDLDIVDIMYLLKHFFPKEKTQDDYIAMINFLISEKEIIITDDHLPIVIYLILDFINFLNNI